MVRQNLPFRPDWEKVITPVLDHLVTRSDVDPGKIALLGVSQAGYWVPRSVAFEHRVAAAVADPGVVDVSTTMLTQVPHHMPKMIEKFDKEMALAVRFSAATRSMMAFRMCPYGTTSPYEFFTAARAYALTDVIIEQITCPMLITDPDHEQFWPGQSQELFDKLPGKKTLIRFTEEEGADHHSCMAAVTRHKIVAQRFNAGIELRPPALVSARVSASRACALATLMLCPNILHREYHPPVVVAIQEGVEGNLVLEGPTVVGQDRPVERAALVRLAVSVHVEIADAVVDERAVGLEVDLEHLGHVVVVEMNRRAVDPHVSHVIDHVRRLVVGHHVRVPRQHRRGGEGRGPLPRIRKQAQIMDAMCWLSVSHESEEGAHAYGTLTRSIPAVRDGRHECAAADLGIGRCCRELRAGRRCAVSPDPSPRRPPRRRCHRSCGQRWHRSWQPRCDAAEPSEPLGSSRA